MNKPRPARPAILSTDSPSPAPSPITRPCLKCRQLITVKDRTREWLCDDCRQKNKFVLDLPVNTPPDPRHKDPFQ